MHLYVHFPLKYRTRTGNIVSFKLIDNYKIVIIWQVSQKFMYILLYSGMNTIQIYCKWKML